MSLDIKSLSDGVLGTTKATLYTVPAAKQTIFKRGVFSNTSTGTVTVEIYFKASGGTSRRIERFEIPPEGTGKLQDEVTLEVGEIIEGKADSGSAIDFVLSGVERAE